ncbi:MAG: hypothetical protein GX264_07755 [Clostridiales bacterium]|nr:hypothetical protein [Clostridiales bacterium]
MPPNTESSLFPLCICLTEAALWDEKLVTGVQNNFFPVQSGNVFSRQANHILVIIMPVLIASVYDKVCITF